MSSHRLQQINELIKQELGKIILVEGDFEPNVLVTILEAKTSQDLRQSTVILSVWPDNLATGIFKKITARAPYFQQLLIKKLKMHPVPQITFSLNQDESQSQKIDTLLSQVKNNE